METTDGRSRRTQDDDRKGVILNRVRHFLQTGVVLEETRFPSAAVGFEPLPRKLTATDRLFDGNSGAEEKRQHSESSHTPGFRPQETTRDQIPNGLFSPTWRTRGPFPMGRNCERLRHRRYSRYSIESLTEVCALCGAQFLASTRFFPDTGDRIRGRHAAY